MPTARELLEQADALMRRNRGDTGIPVLTDSIPDAALVPARSGPSTRERTGTTARPVAADARGARDRGLREEPHRAAEGARAGDAVSPQASTRGAATGAPPGRGAEALTGPAPVGRGGEPPLLTDAVDEGAVEIGHPPLPDAEGEPSLWLGPDTTDPALHSITGPAPDTVAVVPPMTLRAAEPRPEAGEDRDPTVTRTLRAAGSAPTPPPARSAPPPADEGTAPAGREPAAVAPGNDEERWRALAEQISMQVLQRLDLFIDTGLKAQLASHLQPIVARASAELVETINEHVGQLVRTYVAEAIEREIAQWRQQNK